MILSIKPHVNELKQAHAIVILTMISLLPISSFRGSQTQSLFTQAGTLPVPTYSPIERIYKPSYEEFFRTYDCPSRPVVISGAVDDWQALSMWSLQWFKQNYGDKKVPIAVGPRLESRLQWSQLGDFVDLCNSDVDGEQVYLRQFPIIDCFRELEGDFAPPAYCHPERRLVTNLWIGPSGTVQPLHKDNHNPIALIHNLLVQVVGRKRILLVSGNQDHLMYQRPPSQKDYHYSQVDVEHPDFELFPLFRHAEILEATIGPGEMIFIPSNTWHFVRSLEKSISISFWWNPSKVVDLISRLASSKNEIEVSDTVTSHVASISIEDIEEIGGIPILVKAIRTLPPTLVPSFYEMCAPPVQAGIRLCYR